MNERIQELAEQAWTMVSDEERARNQLYEADTQRERRDQVFAELIVQECVLVECSLIMKSSKCEVRGMELLIKKIYEHFGVEE